MTESTATGTTDEEMARPYPLVKPPNWNASSKSLTSQIVWGAIMELRAQGLAISRQRLMTLSGLTYSKVDDHLSRWVDDGYMHRVLDGVYEVVEQFPEARSISVTVLPVGVSKIEIGDICMDLYPQERRTLGIMLLGDAVTVSNLQASHELDGRLTQLQRELRELKRALGG